MTWKPDFMQRDSFRLSWRIRFICHLGKIVMFYKRLRNSETLTFAHKRWCQNPLPLRGSAMKEKLLPGWPKTNWKLTYHNQTPNIISDRQTIFCFEETKGNVMITWWLDKTRLSTACCVFNFIRPDFTELEWTQQNHLILCKFIEFTNTKHSQPY